MFTGIIEETGKVEAIRTNGGLITLTVRARLIARGLKIGASISVNGCCLTVVKIRRRARHALLDFNLLAQTWNVTNLQFAKIGTGVNLERALSTSGRLDGHFVTGHVDGLGKVTRWEQIGGDWLLEVEPPAEVRRLVIPKGSIALNGISLTVAELSRKRFIVWIIPHTLKVTNLSELQAGGFVNLEADLLGKYADALLRPLRR